MLINILMMSENHGKFIMSFSNAIRGIAFLFKSQLNARIEFIIAGIAIVSGLIFRISTSEWIIILMCIALVLSLEGINTAIEIFADKIHPGFDKEIGKAKDAAAGAVLIVSLFAAIIGIIIFAPRLIILFLN
jgi:diacylglycerol kinase (ATP)